MKLTDESTYEMVHSNLNALELTDDIGASMIGRNAVIQNSQVNSKQINSRSNLKQTSAQ